jgi:hypothetical protein
VPEWAGAFRELQDWPDLPIVCDNNLLASSRAHFERVIDRLKRHRGVDFNQGLDARLLTMDIARRLAELDGIFRLSWDTPAQEGAVFDALTRLWAAAIPKDRIRCYVLIGYNDTAEFAHDRCRSLVALGILPNPQRYVPLDSLTRRYVGPGWTDKELTRICRYYARESLWAMRRGGEFRIPYEEFDAS